MSKRAETAAIKAYPFLPTNVNNDVLDDNKEPRAIYQHGYEQAEKDIWDRIEKYLKTRHHMDYATVGFILNNFEYYKQKIMEDE